MGRPDALPELIARSADRSRLSTAVRRGELALTYTELRDLAVQLAAELACAGVGARHVVALDLPESPRPIAAMQACGILGAAFLALDRRDPAARRWADVRESGAAAAVTEDAILVTGANARLDGRPAYLVRADDGPAERPTFAVVDQDTAVEHVETAVAEYRIRPGDRQLKSAPAASVLAVEEVFTTLSVGATLLLRDREFAHDDAAGFLRLADESGLTVLTAPVETCEELGRALCRRPRLLLPLDLRLLVTGDGTASPEAHAAWHAAARDTTFRIVASVASGMTAGMRRLSLTR